MIKNNTVLAAMVLLLGGCQDDASDGTKPAPPFQVSTEVTGQGQLLPSSLSLEPASSGEFMVQAKPGYRLTQIAGCQGQLQGDRYHIANLVQDCIVSAHFEAIEPPAPPVAPPSPSEPPAPPVAPPSPSEPPTPPVELPLPPEPPVTSQVSVSATIKSGQGLVAPVNQTLAKGEVANVTIKPAQNYQIADLSGCEGQLNGNVFSTVPLINSCALAVNFKLEQYQVSTQAGVGGSLQLNQAMVNAGERVVVIVQPAQGYQIAAVSGCGGQLVGNRYTTAPMRENCTVSATFAAQYQVTAQAAAGGSISPSGKQWVGHGEVRSFNVQAQAGYQLDKVSGCAGQWLNERYTTAPINADCIVNASFKPLYQVKASASTGGTISPSGEQAVPAGEVLSFMISPDPAYQIAKVTGCDGQLFGDRYVSAPIAGHCEVAASFAPMVTVTGQSLGHGQLLPVEQVVPVGQTVSLTIEPEQGYVVADVQGCGGQFDEASHRFSYQTAALTQSCTVTARFISDVEHALLHQHHQWASEPALLAAMSAQLGQLQDARLAILTRVFANINEPINWSPRRASLRFINRLPTGNAVVIRPNMQGSQPANNSPYGLLMAGEQSGQRYAVAAEKPFDAIKPDQVMKNLISWLTREKVPSLSDPLKIVTIKVWEGSVIDWLETHYKGIYQRNPDNSCDSPQQNVACISADTDLIILSQQMTGGNDYASIAQAMEKAKALKIPLLIFNDNRFDSSPILQPLFDEMGLLTETNYWSQLKVNQLLASDMLQADNQLAKVEQLLNDLTSRNFDTAWLAGCSGNFIHCNDPTFSEHFKTGADYFRLAAEYFDKQGIDPFSRENGRLLQMGLLLADKYRAAIDYPIAWTDHLAWQQALLADWVVSYARKSNLPQPDLGEYVQEARLLKVGEQAHYRYPATQSQTRDINVPYTGQWTTTGWYVLPGQPVTLTRNDQRNVQVQVQLNYHRPNTNRAFEQHVFRAPLELATQRLPLPAGKSVTFSSPYGGPIYLYLTGVSQNDDPLQVNVSAQGVAIHPSVFDFSDEQQISQFSQLIQNTELPHVDLRMDGAEQHLRKDKLLSAISGRLPTVEALLKSIRDEHLNSVYTLAGFKIQGKTLSESLPTAVSQSCRAIFASEQDCNNEKLHRRTIIQHANYDQNAQCGSGCSGNPWDAAWAISPIGWGDNHELGHNLQVNRLNVQYAPADKSDDWSGYSSRAGENSNNIFPYVVKWQSHYLTDGQTSVLTDGHMNHKDLFNVFMSDAAGITNNAGERVVLGSNCKPLDAGASRYEAPWANNGYAVHNGYRMAYYIQMALRAHNMVLTDGTQLNNGYQIFTLLYLHQRIFGQYAANEASWNANKERLGFGLFPYQGHTVYGGKKVGDIPGNDFMLVALAKLTGLNWQSHFDLLGLRYSSLALEQANMHAAKGALAMGMYVLEQDLPPANMSEGLTFLPLSLSDSRSQWPRGVVTKPETLSPVNCAKTF